MLDEGEFDVLKRLADDIALHFRGKIFVYLLDH